MAILVSQQAEADELRKKNGTSLKVGAELAREMYMEYVNAEKAVLTSQAYQIGGQSLTRANLEQIRKGRQEWQMILENLTGGGQRRFRSVTPNVNL